MAPPTPFGNDGGESEKGDSDDDNRVTDKDAEDFENRGKVKEGMMYGSSPTGPGGTGNNFRKLDEVFVKFQEEEKKVVEEEEEDDEMFVEEEEEEEEEEVQPPTPQPEPSQSQEEAVEPPTQTKTTTTAPPPPSNTLQVYLRIRPASLPSGSLAPNPLPTMTVLPNSSSSSNASGEDTTTDANTPLPTEVICRPPPGSIHHKEGARSSDVSNNGNSAREEGGDPAFTYTGVFPPVGTEGMERVGEQERVYREVSL